MAMSKHIIRRFEITRDTAIDHFADRALAEVRLVDARSNSVATEEKISDVPYRIGESDLTLVCRAVMNADLDWNFPWWSFKNRWKLREFREFNNWGLRI